MFQMAPMNWLMLYIFFSTIFMIFNMKNYFLMKISLKNNPLLKNNLKINWKW